MSHPKEVETFLHGTKGMKEEGQLQVETLSRYVCVMCEERATAAKKKQKNI